MKYHMVALFSLFRIDTCFEAVALRTVLDSGVTIFSAGCGVSGAADST